MSIDILTGIECEGSRQKCKIMDARQNFNLCHCKPFPFLRKERSTQHTALLKWLHHNCKVKT